MSDTPDSDSDDVLNFDDAADVLTERAQFDGTATVGGQTVPIRVREPTLGELEEIENGLPDDAEEVDVARAIIDDYLVKPEGIAGNDLGITRAMALFSGMVQAWQQTDEFEGAVEELGLDEGNG